MSSSDASARSTRPPVCENRHLSKDQMNLTLVFISEVEFFPKSEHSRTLSAVDRSRWRAVYSE